MLDNQVNLYDDWALGRLRYFLENYLKRLIQDHAASQMRSMEIERANGKVKGGTRKDKDGEEIQDRKERDSEPSWATVGSHISACRACEEILYDEDEFEALAEDVDFADMPDRTGVSGDIVNDGILRRFVEGQKVKKPDGTTYRRYSPPSKPKFLEAIFLFLQDQGDLNPDDLKTPQFEREKHAIDQALHGPAAERDCNQDKLLFEGDFIHQLDDGETIKRSAITLHKADMAGEYNLRMFAQIYKRKPQEGSAAFRQRFDRIRPDEFEEWLGKLSHMSNPNVSWVIASETFAGREIKSGIVSDILFCMPSAENQHGNRDVSDDQIVQRFTLLEAADAVRGATLHITENETDFEAALAKRDREAVLGVFSRNANKNLKIIGNSGKKKVVKYSNRVLFSNLGDRLAEDYEDMSELEFSDEIMEQFFNAAWHGDSDTLRTLLDQGVDVNAVDPRNGYTAIQLAAFRCSWTAVPELLKEENINLLIKDEDNCSPSALAYMKGASDVRLSRILMSAEIKQCAARGISDSEFLNSKDYIVPTKFKFSPSTPHPEGYVDVFETIDWDNV